MWSVLGLDEAVWGRAVWS